MDHIADRYEMPEQVYEETPQEGACWNCSHSTDVKLDGYTYCLCVKQRDDGSMGDVTECPLSTSDCEWWESV